MKLKKAIQIQNDHFDQVIIINDPDYKNATNLGIEAIHAWLELRKGMKLPEIWTLPSETEN